MTSTCDCTFQMVNCEFVFLTKSLRYRQAIPASIFVQIDMCNVCSMECDT